MSLAALALLLFAALVCTAALTDLTSYTIPNWISGALLLAFPVAALAAGLPWGLAAQHAAVGGAALVLGMGMFAMNWVGGGDAKLLSASALWLGLGAAPEYLMWVALVGGGLTFALLGARKAYELVPLPTVPGWAQALLSPKGDVPYGVALAVGALMALPESDLFAAAL
jgi:prepilin peptidase CpaA